MQSLLSSNEVIELAYTDTGYLPERRIGTEDIALAESRYLIPVTGQRLWSRLLAGGYPTLRSEYVAQAAAYAARLSLHASIEALAPAAQASLRARFMTSLRDLSNHLNAEASQYPEYDAAENILNRISTEGGVVLPV